MRLLDHDPLTGMSTYHTYDELTKQTVIKRTQDITKQLDLNVTKSNDPDYWRQGVKANFAHYGHIPNIIIEQWLKEGINVYDPAHTARVLRKMNDPDFKKLKTTTAVELIKG
jgi:hypothetical protein